MQITSYGTYADLHEEYLRVKPFNRYLPISKDDTFLSCIHDILINTNFMKCKEFKHHGNTSCYQHQLSVAYYTYKLCSRFGLKSKEAARGAILHDFFLYDWHTLSKDEKKHHSKSHPNIALSNAEKYFELTDMQKDIIKKHMWPLTISLPKYKETFIVTLVDKVCCIMEVMVSIFGNKNVDSH